MIESVETPGLGTLFDPRDTAVMVLADGLYIAGLQNTKKEIDICHHDRDSEEVSWPKTVIT